MKMSERTFNKFKEGLTTLFYDYTSDYTAFCEKTEKLLNEAYNHREISQEEYLALLLIHENMRSSLAFSFLED